MSVALLACVVHVKIPVALNLSCPVGFQLCASTFYAMASALDLHGSLSIYVYLACIYKSLEKKKREIPLEIDDHFKLFGKEPWEVDYGEKCPVCDMRIDEYGFCSCGSSGD